ncbi:uncharacterized protein LOC126796882 [Argentina anserina]|uniref:uncharacterized protein LOC126796882 n=1 Tax=Argentina anserina TaxID=57926 RepID=UPI0021768A6C|nr:uncharacterized protein LOC126796882 [Potentilla anserina]
MACVTRGSFSIVLNGTPGGFFTPTRGLRQGDPLSPYLFLLVSEVLSLRLTKEVAMKKISGVKLAPSCPPLSHLFFADDSLFFMKATLLNCSRVSTVFKDYCLASGQMISTEKSSIYFSPNTPTQLQRLMCLLMGIGGTDKPGCYLGLPTFWGRSKNGALTYIKDRFMGKVEGWKQKYLSQAGKEILLKSVALAIPTFPMRTNLIIKEIRRRSSAFDWVGWEWIPRSANRAAHEAAKLGQQTLGLRTWSETPPPSLTLVLRSDGFPCPHNA